MELYSLPRNLLGARTKNGVFITLDAKSPIAAAIKTAAETEHARVLAEVDANLNEDGSTDQALADLFNGAASETRGNICQWKNNVPEQQRSWKSNRRTKFRAA
jgi:hypothetical protein